MIRNYGPYGDFSALTEEITRSFLFNSEVVDVGQWQSTDISDKPEMVTRELANVCFAFKWDLDNQNVQGMQSLISANQPWAENHFQERVSGIPYNPPPSHQIWPYAQADNDQWVEGSQFSHTYPERMWPRHAGGPFPNRGVEKPLAGIRFLAGDLDDVVNLLLNHRLTRQAFLPIWFPEDTGVVHGKRVPCTLGYHFLIRRDFLTVTYYIRSCDFRRHFADDLYMAARLAQWVALNLSEQFEMRQEAPVKANAVIMHIASLHIFQGDWDIMKRQEGAARFIPNKPADVSPRRPNRAGAILHQSIMDGLA